MEVIVTFALMLHILLRAWRETGKRRAIEVQIEVQIERGHRVPGLNFRIISNLSTRLKKYSMANIEFHRFLFCEDLGLDKKSQILLGNFLYLHL